MDELTHPLPSKPVPPSRTSHPRLLCLGGSFNPPHLGHFITARAAAEAAGFDGVRLIIAADPPHKPDDPTVISARHRLEMTRRAVSGDAQNRFTWLVDDREIRRGEASYTVLTARELLAEGTSRAPIEWLIGADLLPGLIHWHEAQTLLQGDFLRFRIMRRGGYDIDWASLPPPVQGLRDRVVEVPGIEISATDIRRRVAEGRPIRYLVPNAVEQYIIEHGLYGAPAHEAWDNLSLPGAKLGKSG